MRRTAIALVACGLLAAACADPEESLERARTAQEEGDFETAAAMYEKLARRGMPQAQMNLGWLHFHGRGVPKDLEQTARWWREAAESGDAEAQMRLAMLYRAGAGVSRDPAEAARWWRLAAEQGLPVAQHNLAKALLSGEGAPPDPVEAYVWLHRAAEQGHTLAARERDELIVQLSPEQLGRARAIVDSE